MQVCIKVKKITLKSASKSIDSDAPTDQAEEGGASPTLTLQKQSKQSILKVIHVRR